MNSIISAIITVFFTVPVLGLLIIYFLYKLITKNSRKSFHKALDYSTVLFITAVHFLIITISGESLLWLILLVMILSAMVFVVVHWKIKGEIVFNRVFKGFWRFNFLFFFFVYLSLTVFGLLHRALTFTFF